MNKHAVAQLGGNVNLWGVLRSESIKFFSLLSTRILILVAIVVMVGFAAVSVWSIGIMMEQVPAGTPGIPDFTAEGFGAEIVGSGVAFAQLIVGALAVLMITGEFSTGSAVSTFLASPQRLRVLGAKALLMILVSAVVGIVSFVLSYLVSQPIAKNYGIALSFSSESFQRSLWFGTLYIVMVSMIGLALGTMLRNSAGGITLLVALFFVLPIATQIIGSMVEWFQELMRFLPDQAGMSLAFPLSYPTNLETWQLLLVVGGWMVIPMVIGALVLKLRDI